MSKAPAMDDLFAVMSAASYGDPSARVEIPTHPQLEDVPTRFGLALNVLLDDLSFRERAQARMAERLRVLCEAARDFASTAQNEERLLDRVVRRLATVVKDQCVLFLLSNDGRELLPAAIHALDAEVERRTTGFFSSPLRVGAHPLAGRVSGDGKPFLAREVDPIELRASTTPQYADYAQAIGLHSVMVVQLRDRGEPLGQIVMSRYRAGSVPFDEDDLELVSALADHAVLAIRNARSYAAERAARLLSEHAVSELRLSEARYRLMFDNSPLPKWFFDLETLRYLAVNDAAIRDYGYSREEFLTMTIKDIRPIEDVEAVEEAVRDEREARNAGIWRHRKKNGELISVEITTHQFTYEGRVCRLVVGRNVTEQLRLEEQLRQSQKMDAVGRLAGGIAHDFNNVLSIILSYASLALGEMKPGEPMREDIAEIQTAGRRAADLTRQLLMFSRQQVVAPRVVDLNEVLVGMDKMLQRVLGADIDLMSLPAEHLGRVRVDASSMEQLILNLVVNARDAMPTGGKLTLETTNVVLDEEFARGHLGARPGPHVMLAVTDTGVGMDKALQGRIFEPFFTTKEKGKGTGLGLSTVFGIVQQSGGSIWVYSEVGHGTTFKIYLPRVDEALERTQTPATGVTRVGTETILLVEDDDQVRQVARGILRKSGYHVIEARNAGEALLCAEKHPQPIQLLLSDVVMPQLSGPELAKRLAQLRPEMRVLCMSGYTDDSIVRHGVLDGRMAFLQKPFTPETLSARVREVLDSSAPGH